MKIIGLHHVAFAHVRGAPTLAALSQFLGLRPTHLEHGAGFAERTIPVGPGKVCLQTLERTGPGVIESFIERRGSALHHVAFEVADLAAAIQELDEEGARLIDSTPQPGASGTRIAFIHPSTFGGLLVELVEEP